MQSVLLMVRCSARTRKDSYAELMEKMYNERVIFKKRMLKQNKNVRKAPTKDLEKEIVGCNNVQMVRRLCSLFMVSSVTSTLGTTNLLNAEAITLSGSEVSIRWIENKMNRKMNSILKTEDKDYVIAF